MKKIKKDFIAIDIIVGNMERDINDKSGRFFSPQMDVYEVDGGIFVDIELPGVNNKDIKVLWDSGKLIIKGMKDIIPKKEKLRYYLLERPYGNFEKIVQLPNNIDIDKINATFKNGVLKVFAPYKV